LAILTACNPQRRLNRLVKKHPELVKVDTLIIRDSFKITVPSIQIDTFVKLEQLKDTIYFQKDFVTVKLFQRNDTIFMLAKTDTIFKTVYKEIKVPYKFVEPKKPPQYFKYSLLFLLLLGISVIYYQIKYNKTS
jgi:hypothetical protein